ncbi:hypothetical protein OIO90_005363 [Microbotryomycetes sp. JL221]|nr:hypothetical protein OIO90_005363 [Microbotryomycetes sp. JL221]
MAAATAPKPYPVHLLVVCHGSHVQYISSTAERYAQAGKMQPWQPASTSKPNSTSDSNGMRLVVLPAKLNEYTHTYDGIDVCSERVVTEIDDEIESIRQQGGVVKRFSIVGYSLGGLVARYVLGLLESRQPSFFVDVKPVNFTTFASPAIGIPSYQSFWSSTFRFLGARLLSRTGAQLYEKDRFLPTTAMQRSMTPDDKQANGCQAQQTVWSKLGLSSLGKPKAEPLLSVMADPRYNFYKALAAFEKIDVYCNTVNDRTVPFPTGSISAHDPFALARSKAQKRAEARGDEPDAILDLADGGLELALRPDAPIIVNYNQVTVPELTPEELNKKQRFRLRLPLLLRPTTYPFSRPVSLLVIVCLPVALPLLSVYLVGRFMVQTRASRRRIKDIRKTTGGGREGMLARVGVKLGEVAEQVGVDNPEYAAGLAQESSEARSSTNSNVFNGDDGNGREEERKRLKQDPTLSDLINYGGTDTPPFARSQAPSDANFADAPVDNSSTRQHETSSRSSGTLVDEATTGDLDATVKRPRLPTDPILSTAQLDMIRHLNSIPHLTKHFVYLPRARNSHGAMVARDLNWPQHHQGKKVVESWAADFKL